jgi:hypothetical protein
MRSLIALILKIQKSSHPDSDNGWKKMSESGFTGLKD